MGKYDLFLSRAGPQSLVEPTRGSGVEGKEGVRRDGPTFDEILAGVLPSGTVQVPEDVQRKLAEHGIELTPRDLDRIGRGIDQLVDEGGRESLLVSERVAYQVDVPARSITQVFVRKELEQTVFTNVDSVVLLDE